MVDFGIETVEFLERDTGNSVRQDGPFKAYRYGDNLANWIARRCDRLTERLDAAVEASIEIVRIGAEYDEQVGRLRVTRVRARGERVQKYSFCERATGEQTGVVVRGRIASQRARDA